MPKVALEQLTQGMKLGLDLLCWEVDRTQEEYVGVHKEYYGPNVQVEVESLLKSIIISERERIPVESEDIHSCF